MRFVSNILLLFICIICGLTIVSAQDVDVPKMREIKGKKLLDTIRPLQHKKGLWGYANKEGKYIVKPEFTEVREFEGNVARVSFEGKWGVVGHNGLYIVSPKYNFISKFSADSVAIAELDGGYWLINHEGKILTSEYQSIENKEYGYLARSASLYGTLDANGQTILQPQFEAIIALDDGSSVEMFDKDGKWGLLNDGRDILVHKWDSQPVPFKAGDNLDAIVYMVSQNGDVGVVSSYGECIVPYYYDNIELDSSGKYFVTTKGENFGALTLKLRKILPPIYSDPPILSDSPFRAYDGESFYAGYVDGTTEFKYLSGIYLDLYGYDNYVATTDFPVWTKDVLIEENISSINVAVNNSRKVIDVLSRHGNDIAAASADEEMPADIPLTFSADDQQKYGIFQGGKFVANSGGSTTVRGRSFSTLYEGQNSDILFLYDSFDGGYYISVKNRLYSIKDIFSKYKIKPYNGFYPIESLNLPNGLIAVHLAFVRSTNDSSTSLFETDPNMLASYMSNIKMHTGASKLVNEIHAVLIINTHTLSADQFIQLSKSSGYKLLGTSSGAFYVDASSSLLADAETPLRRYDKDGLMDWEFRPAAGEKFYDIEETENYIYLCGSLLERGKEKPIILQLTKQGIRHNLIVEPKENAYFSNIKCSGYLMYARTSKVKSSSATSEYYPYRALADLNDNVGVKLCCQWENWGGAQIGGCGLVSMDGKWIQSPILDKNDICTSYGWEFGSFAENILVVRHFGRYGAINRKGQLIVDTKYDEVVELANKDYVKASLNGRSCVYDVDGRVIVPADYDYVGSMNEDIIIVSKDGLYGCYDKNGNIVVPLAYDEIREFSDGMAAVRVADKYGFINSSGDIVINPFADDVGDFSEGAVWAKVGSKVGFVSVQGEWIVQPTYDAGGAFSCGLAPIMINNKYGFVDRRGVIRVPAQYDEVDTFNSDFEIACVLRNDKWGVIVADGRIIIPIEFDFIEFFPDGYIIVKRDGMYGIYTSSGDEVFPVSCSSIAYKRNADLFWYGSVSARSEDERSIVIDYHGNIIYPFAKVVGNR